jgi:hypothetical protein
MATIANDRRGYLGSRMEKAALNQQSKTMAQAFKDSPDPMIPLALEPDMCPPGSLVGKEKKTLTRLQEERSTILRNAA